MGPVVPPGVAARPENRSPARLLDSPAANGPAARRPGSPASGPPAGPCHDGRVLFPQRFWAGLADGSVTVTFRRWSAPRAKVGARHRTPAGVLEVLAVDRVAVAAIDDADARRAGFTDRAALLADLGGRRGRPAVAGRAPPRGPGSPPAAAGDRPLEPSGAGRAAPAARTTRPGQPTRSLDRGHPPPHRRSSPRSWRPTWPGRWAANGWPFKADVRKLKELGLTESLTVGYRLSPRGRAVLDDLEARRA